MDELTNRLKELQERAMFLEKEKVRIHEEQKANNALIRKIESTLNRHAEEAKELVASVRDSKD